VDLELLMDWKALGGKLAALGLPLLGGALAGPGGALVGKGIAAALGLGESATPEQAAAALGTVTGEQLVALRAIEADLAKEQIKADSARDAGQVELVKGDQQRGLYDRGWRPGAGWVCLFGLAYTFILRPLVPWVLRVCGVEGVPDLPPIDTAELFVLLGGMLGLGGLRTKEKLAGKA
jgi:hypothetical protein